MSVLQQSLLLLLSLLFSRGLAGYSNTTLACGALYSTLPGQVAFPGSQGYENSISTYAYLGTRLRPTCLVSPKSTADVTAVIKALGEFDSVAFAIRGGGHNTNKGFSDIEDGITVDLSAINTVQLDPSAKIISVGAGARWQSVYNALDPYGLSVQGGRTGSVGVGGFLTGGGIGFYSPELGWACDSVANMEVVLSNGSVVNANAASHPDLFTALKGGQNNFGVVTRFDLKTLVQGPLWGGVIFYSNSTDQELLDVLIDFKDPKKFDPHAMLTFGFLYDTAQGALSANIAMYHSRPESVNGSTLDAFAKVQPQVFSSIRVGSPGSFAGEKLSAFVKHYYMEWSTTTFATNPTTLSSIYDAYKSTSFALTHKYASANLTTALSIQSVPAAAPASNPNSLGFDPSSHPEKNLLNIGLAFQYEDPAATEGLQLANRKLALEVDQIAKTDGVSDNHLYMNYAGSWQSIFSGYGTKSVESMIRVAKAYDPRGMFQKQVTGGFKLYR